MVSASALRTEGQLTVLNNPPLPAGDKAGGPCYRCVFPKPPPANSVTSCADGGILGPVVGTMGVLQALEAIKVITSPTSGLNGGPGDPPALHIFSAYSSPPFRTIRLRTRRPTCASCSENPTVTLDTIKSGSIDYIFFCGTADPELLLSPNERISPLEYRSRHPVMSSETLAPGAERRHTLIDVRDKAQFDICNLENSINIPISTILGSSSARATKDVNGDSENNLPPWVPADIASSESTDPIYVVCRLGNDSQVVVKKLKELGLDRGGERYVGDIQGGLQAWRGQVDSDFPEY